MFSCKFCKFFTEPFWTTASEVLQWTNRNQVFSIFEHVLLRLSNVMNIMNFAVGKLYFAKLARVSFLWSYILKAYNVIEKRLIMSLAFFFRDLFHRILANNSFWNCEQESINYLAQHVRFASMKRNCVLFLSDYCAIREVNQAWFELFSKIF